MNKGKITYIDEAKIVGKRVFLRVDFDVSLNDNYTISDDVRIQHKLPTIKLLLKNHNRIICCSKLGRPKTRTPELSMQVVVDRLQSYLPDVKVRLIEDFLAEPAKTFKNQTEKEILVLENIRFYPQEKNNDPQFAKYLAELADVYVNDAFAICHRAETSLVILPTLLPSYGGLSLRREIESMTRAISHPKRPFVAIIGGSKISTKINLITRLMERADYVILGGGLANVFFRAQRYSIGKSIGEYEMVLKARQLLFLAAQKKTSIILPSDALIGDPKENEKRGKLVKIGDKIPSSLSILDIGPETKARFGAIIASARTIIWNGPVGMFENPAYRQGTDFIYYALAHNPKAVSIVGGGDTLAAISHKKFLEKITHISTGGGAMLEFIEKGTLPAIEALKK
jgi:phosphoglycerate kinase